MKREEIENVIRSVPLFEGCGEIAFVKHLFYRGETVSDETDGVPCVGIVAEGKIDVLPGGTDSLTVSTLSAGGMFGICNIFARAPMPTRLRCRSKATVAYIRKDTFVDMMRRDPALALRYGTLCNEKILFLARRLEEAQLPDTGLKVRAFLRSAATECDGVKKFSVPSKEALARLCGVSRSALFRELAALRDAGLIECKQKTIVIKGDL